MKNKLPLKVNIRKETVRRAEVKGIYQKELFSRLNKFVISIDSDIDVTYSANKDVCNNDVLIGEASCLITLLCVRCFENFTYSLKTNFCFVPENNDNNARLLIDQGYSPLQYDEFGDINLLEAIEDELIVSIPLNPKMPEEQCSYQDNQTFGIFYEEDFQDKVVESSKNPFAGLAALKDKIKK